MKMSLVSSDGLGKYPLLPLIGSLHYYGTLQLADSLIESQRAFL